MIESVVDVIIVFLGNSPDLLLTVVGGKLN